MLTKSSESYIINYMLEVVHISNVGQFIKEKREASGMSQKKLGDACGVSDSEILKIENGIRKKPNWTTLCAVAKALNFHPIEIMFKAGYITEEDIHPTVKLYNLDKLNANQIQEVQLFIDFIIHKEQSIRR